MTPTNAERRIVKSPDKVNDMPRRQVSQSPPPVSLWGSMSGADKNAATRVSGIEGHLSGS